MFITKTTCVRTLKYNKIISKNIQYSWVCNSMGLVSCSFITDQVVIILETWLILFLTKRVWKWYFFNGRFCLGQNVGVSDFLLKKIIRTGTLLSLYFWTDECHLSLWHDHKTLDQTFIIHTRYLNTCLRFVLTFYKIMAGVLLAHSRVPRYVSNWFTQKL